MGDEGVLDVRSLVRGFCVAISNVVTFHMHCDSSFDCWFWRERL